MSELVFLSVEDVLLIHALQIEQFGGSPGLRDRALLDSAAAQPQATFDGTFVHEDVFAMAAAFADSNEKRALSISAKCP